MTWVVLGGLCIILVVPPSLLLLRRQPEDMGLRPDGGDPPPGPHGKPIVEEYSWTRREALRSPAFWRLMAVFSMSGLATGAIGVHRIPFFMDRGLEPRLVAYATAMDAGAAGIVMLFLGLVADRLSMRGLGIAAFAILMIASILLISAHTVPVMFIALATFGTGAGANFLIQNYLWAGYFGRVHLGSIRGVVLPVTLVFGGAGAPLAGYVRDLTGSYTLAWTGSGVLLFLSALLLAITPRPERLTRQAGLSPAGEVTS